MSFSLLPRMLVTLAVDDAQAHPFVLAPADWPWPEEGVVGAEAVHRVLRGWLARLGHEAYAEAVKG